MASSTEKIRDSFPFLTVDPILGEPSYESIKALHQKLNTNAASVRSHLGNGRLGLLYLTVTPEVYNTLSEVEFVPPPNPGPTVEYPDNATQYQIQATNKAYEKAAKLFNEYDACDRALKQLLLGAVDDMFINALCDRHVGYANVTTLDMLTHLYDTYGKITEIDLNKNQEVMNEPFDHNLPIESFFRRIEECVEFAAAGNTPFSPKQAVSQAFYNIQRSGLFSDDIREWKRFPQADKTWDRFKTHFARAYHELKEASATAKSAGYSGNNAIQEDHVQALTNLANATVADRETMANLTATINSLSLQLSQTNAKLNDALATTARLQSEIQSLKEGKKSKEKSSFTKYCWTHGIQCGHSSAECNKRAEGHREEATEENKLGGRTTKWQRYRK